MTGRRLKHIGIGLVFLILQLVLFRHLTIFEAYPDLVLIFLVWYMSKENRTAALLMGASLGFLQDALLDIWGLNMFSKTLLIYVVHRFIPKDHKTQLSVGQVVITVALAALFHNLIFLGLNIFIQNYTAETLFGAYLLGSSLYSAIVAALFYMFRTNK